MTSQKYIEYRELLSKGRYIEAARLAEMAYVEGDRNNPFWLTRQAAASSRANKYDDAYDIAKQALSLNHSNPYALLAVADALRGLHRIDEALQYYQEIIGDPKLSLYAQKGVLYCLSIQKEWDRILQFLSRWEMPHHENFQWKVKALAGQKQIDDAIETCCRWLELFPDRPQALWELTELEIQRDGIESVLSKMGRIAKIHSRPMVYKEIYASLCRRAGKPEQALKQYEKLSRMSADTRIQKKQAFALAKSGMETEAIPIFEELMKLNPKDFYLHSAYIPACARAGLLDRALIFYEDLVELYPEEKPLYGRIRKVQNMLDAKPS